MSSLPKNKQTLSIAPIVALNQTGIRSMNLKDFGTAIKSFSKAIAYLRILLADYTGDHSLDLSCCSAELIFSFALTLSAAAHEMAHNMADKDTTDTDEHRLFVFETPIQVTSRPTCTTHSSNSSNNNNSSTQDHDMLKTLSFALVFNLAIAHHLCALHHMERKKKTVLMSTIKKRFIKALAFYKLAVGVFENTTTTNTTNLSLGVMEIVAIANNQAHIHMLLHEPEMAQECYQQVLGHVLCVADKGQRDQILQFERFLSNVIVKPSPTATAA